MGENSDLLTLYSDIRSVPVNWLWYPYIAIGKITLIQGDPGDGKSSVMMNLIAELSHGGKTPDGHDIGEPQRAIYQCSEDGASDTIKPRLIKAGANCNNVGFINEEIHSGLTLDDERLRNAIIAFKPKLVVIDPIQAYLGSDSDLQIAGRARKLMRRLSMWAECYGCAVVLIGHMNKREGCKGLYRGLGSIDVVAAARSVLQVERDDIDPSKRTIVQIKNSLAATGAPVHFKIDSEHGFQWLTEEPDGETAPSTPIIDETNVNDFLHIKTKKERAAYVVGQLLSDKDVSSTEIYSTLEQYGIGQKTVRTIKKELGIKSRNKGGTWYWTLKHDEANV